MYSGVREGGREFFSSRYEPTRVWRYEEVEEEDGDDTSEEYAERARRRVVVD